MLIEPNAYYSIYVFSPFSNEFYLISDHFRLFTNAVSYAIWLGTRFPLAYETLIIIESVKSEALNFTLAVDLCLASLIRGEVV